MRNAFAKKITTLAKKNKKIVLLSGDIGNRLFDDFKSHCPTRFYNCGIAEQNMVGVAAGLAIEGFLPILYTITPFLTSRAFEQIRLDICYPKLNVLIVGTGAGLSYSRLGPTHHSLEDLALMQSLPNLDIFCPGDKIELEKILPKIFQRNKPCYVRLGKKGEPIVNKINKKVYFSEPNVINKLGKIAILTIGNTLSIGNNVQKELQKKGFQSSLISVHTIKPFNLSIYKKLFKNFKKICIIEEHYFHGGLAQIIKANYDLLGIKNKTIIHFSVPFKFHTGLGEQKEARDIVNLNTKKICQKILKKK
jgi:transketolase